MTDRDAPNFAPFIGSYLARQDWVQMVLGQYGAVTLPARVVDVEVLATGRPGLASVVAEVDGQGFHILLGWRDLATAPAVLGGIGAVLGPGADSEGEVLVYDALADPELVREVLVAATGGSQHAERSRIVRSLVSHAAVIFDDRLFMKCYRVVEPGQRPEVETAAGLVRVGFAHLLALAGHWRRNGRDLALVREFIPGAVEGKALAETSLRDLLARAEPGGAGAAFEDVGLAGGDLGAEMRRLGVVTGEMHLALAEAFGRSESGAIRLHGDFHLRRVMRTDRGWIVAGFGDDPLLGSDAGGSSTRQQLVASPLEDLADLCVSLRQCATAAVGLCAPGTRAHAGVLAAGWEQRNVQSFVSGYLSTPDVSGLLPGTEEEIQAGLNQLVESRAT